MAAATRPNKNLLRALLALIPLLLAAGIATAVIRSGDDDSETASGQGGPTTTRPETTSTLTTDVPPSTAVQIPTSAVPTSAPLPSGPAGTSSPTVPATTSTTSRSTATTSVTPTTQAPSGTATTSTTFVFGRNEHPDTGGQGGVLPGLLLAGLGGAGIAFARRSRSKERNRR